MHFLFEKKTQKNVAKVVFFLGVQFAIFLKFSSFIRGVFFILPKISIEDP